MCLKENLFEQADPYLWNIFDERYRKFDIGEEVQIQQPCHFVSQCHKQWYYKEQWHDAKNDAANFWHLLTTRLATQLKTTVDQFYFNNSEHNAKFGVYTIG